ncbi:MAG TPA: FxLYD domain-containing protein [Candidatus Angelobacter sp.]
MPVVESGPMGDAEQKPPTEEPLVSPGGAQDSGTNWTPMIVGAVLVIVAVTLIVILTRNKVSPSHPDPYAAKLEISNLHMATAQNFAGGSVTYIDGTITNTGDKRVTAASVQVTFKNSLGEVVDNPVLPVMVLQPDTPIRDYGPMDRAPLGSGQSREFRLTKEHISADWNGQIPDVKVVRVSAN